MRNFILTFIVLILASCNTSKEVTATPLDTWEVSAERIPCEGESIQDCLQVRTKGSTQWRPFYGTIKGFDYEERNRYTIQIKKSQIKKPRADEASVSYELIKVLDKQRDTSESKPSFRGYFTVTHIREELLTLKDISFNIISLNSRVTGFSGCNAYSTQFLQKDNKLTFEPVMSTKKACKDTQALEQNFISIFKEVRIYEITNGKIILYGRDGVILMRGEITSSP